MFVIRTVFLMIFLAFTFACNSQPEDVLLFKTEYNYFSRMKWALNGKSKLIVGNTLKLNQKDSTFLFETCSCITEGDWKIEGDSLLLNHLKRFNPEIDSSLNCYTPKYLKIINENELMGRNDEERIEIFKKKIR